MSAHLKLAVIVCALLAAATAWAGPSRWQRNHSRRTEVNQRLGNQDRRIRQGVAKGTLTPGQAQALHQEDRQVRQEERDMAAQNGGHITRQEQRTLNQQENRLSRNIHAEKHPQ
jgi:hypothetical protein